MTRRPSVRRTRFKGLLALPGFLWLLVFFVFPLILPAYYSLAISKGAGGPTVGDFPTLQTYGRLADPIYTPIFLRTMVQALLATAAISIIGFPLAYFLATRPKAWKLTLLALVVIPAWSSFLIRTYAWMVLLGTGGPISSLAHWLGLAGSQPRILFTSAAVWIGFIYNYLPLAVLPLWAALERLDLSLLEASQDLGGSPLRTLRLITLPLTAAGIATAMILVFIPLTGEYIIPTLLGGQKVAFAGTIIVHQFQEARDWAFGSAMALSLVFLTLATTGLYLLLLRPALRRAAYDAG